MKTRKHVLNEIRNAQNNDPYEVAELYLLEQEPLWMPDHLASATNYLVQESCGQIHDEDKISDHFFLQEEICQA